MKKISGYIIALITVAATVSAQLYIEGEGGIVVELDQASGSFGIGEALKPNPSWMFIASRMAPTAASTSSSP